jgi:hypothetical protein
MSPQKRRKPMDDAAALGFVYGQPESEPAPNPPAPEPEQMRSQAAPAETKKTTTSDIMSQILQTDTPERTIRFTADLPESLHRKLSMLATRSGKKKVEIVRTILEEVLKDVEV